MEASSPDEDRRAIDLVLRRTSGRPIRGFAPAIDLVTGLAQTLQWYLEHEDWWHDVTSGAYREWYARQYASPSP